MRLFQGRQSLFVMGKRAGQEGGARLQGPGESWCPHAQASRGLAQGRVRVVWKRVRSFCRPSGREAMGAGVPRGVVLAAQSRKGREASATVSLSNPGQVPSPQHPPLSLALGDPGCA